MEAAAAAVVVVEEEKEKEREKEWKREREERGLRHTIPTLLLFHARKKRRSFA